MTNQKVLTFTALGTVLLCVLHFVNSVYVAKNSQQRQLNPEALTVPDNALPYNADTLQQLLVQWSVPAANDDITNPVTTNALSGYDNTQLGDTRIALLAIYQQQKPKAVMALQTSGQDITFVRLAAGESVGDITLTRVSQRDVVITRGAQQVKLQLFNPGSASTE